MTSCSWAAFLSFTRSMLRWMLACGMLAALALSMARRRAKLVSGSAPLRAAMAIMLPSLVNTAPRAASFAPFSRLIVDHFECPDILLISFFLLCYYSSFSSFAPEHQTNETDRGVRSRH